MITGIFGCILMGCLQDVPVIVSRDPVLTFVESVTERRKKVDKSQYSCYINGEFFTSCPTK